jgi:MoaA/NifB/PqqE/SkfB family radical SAM enzyme
MSDPIEPIQILYRGPLESCNYGCTYCPFAKRKESVESSRNDRLALVRLVHWATSQDRPLEILFTPWGEALHHRRYQNAMAELVRHEHIRFVGIQTNLSTNLSTNSNWLASIPETDRSKIGLWASWHPTETTLTAFADRVKHAGQSGVQMSVGMVATREHLSLVPEFADLLKNEWPRVHIWLNAYKPAFRTPVAYYDEEDLLFLRSIDPWFDHDVNGFRTQGLLCETGATSVAVDGNGNVTRCNFVHQTIGNIYAEPLDSILTSPRLCSRSFCGCFQGYVHLQSTPVTIGFPQTARLTRIPVVTVDPLS